MHLSEQFSKYICQNYQPLSLLLLCRRGGKGMYSSDFLNAFVQIAKFVCPNFQINFTKLPNKITFINSDPGISKTHFWCIF